MVRLNKLYPAGLLLLGMLTLSSACTHQTVHHVGSHKVTIARHGFQKAPDVSQRGGVATFKFEGVSTAGEKLKVSIVGDTVEINGTSAGELRAGDCVFIGDEGVAVNSLDYGESEKYLRANNSASESTASN